MPPACYHFLSQQIPRHSANPVNSDASRLLPLWMLSSSWRVVLMRSPLLSRKPMPFFCQFFSELIWLRYQSNLLLILPGRRLWQISYLPASLPLPPDYRNNFCQYIRSGTHQKDAWKYSLIWCYKNNPCRNQKINAKPFHFISNNPFLYRWRICVPFSRLSIVL